MTRPLAVLLVLLWALGLATSYTLGGLIHLLLVFAVALGFLAVIRARADEKRRKVATKHHDDSLGRKSYRANGRS